MIILLHSSKTMRRPGLRDQPLRPPALISQTSQLAAYLKSLSQKQLATSMHLSDALATATKAVIAEWNTASARQSLALDSFIGDIYSGLRAADLSAADRTYADGTLRILSGLYGILRPYDAVMPYRLEMGYKLPDRPFNNLYTFWGRAIADSLPGEGCIVNTSSVEFSKTITPYVDAERLFTPQFLTIDKASGKPTFKVVHAKIARGAFARWLIINRIRRPEDFQAFDDLGYRYDGQLSMPKIPVFVCRDFLGKGLSMRG